ncbi:MAG: type II secretion system F family protein [Acidimicrobiales bacterium]
MSASMVAEVVLPLAHWLGRAAGDLVHVEDDLARRLERVHSPLDPSTFRVRQLGGATVALVVALAVVATARPPGVLAALLVLGSPILAFLVPEQRLAADGVRWQRQVFAELPVVSEQLGMLVSAGYSLGSALDRLAGRGAGAVGADLRRVTAQIRYGASELDALRDWAATVGVDGVDRIVAVLALNHEAGDLGRLIADEARSLRRDAHRELIETIEKRAQMVWVPVTVAALVPGTLFLVVPFFEAMRLFTAP